MFLLALLSTSLIAQSYPPKPRVPVFNVNGERIVRVDCWGIENQMRTLHLKALGHAQVFSKKLPLGKGEKLEIQVSLLDAENTLNLSCFNNHQVSLEVETYGMDCGFKNQKQSVYCSIFDGELEENSASL